MKTIIVRTQAELDKLPNSFDEYTIIEIRSEPNTRLIVNKARESSHVVARESSHVVARGSSHVVARESSHVEAWGSSHVVAWGSSHVVARGSSHVEAWGSSHVVARESSHVVAQRSSHVEAWGSSHVEARGSSHVVARESSHVVARESSHVVARDRAFIRVESFNVDLTLLMYAICAVSKTLKFKPKKKSKTASIVKQPEIEHNINSFLEAFGLKPKNGKVILYKAVRSDNLNDFRTNSISYSVGSLVKPVKFNPSTAVECGDGLHLCAIPELTQTFNVGTIMECEVEVKDIVVYPKDIKKVRCRQVKVLGYYKAKN